MGFLDFSKVAGINTALKALEDAERMNKEASEPILIDRSRMTDVYNHYKTYLNALGIRMDTDKRKKFLFIIVYLYCPAVLVGATMPKMFRRELSQVLGVDSPSSISNDLRDLLFLYTHYADFKNGVDRGYAYVSYAMNLKQPIGWWTEKIEIEE